MRQSVESSLGSSVAAALKGTGTIRGIFANMGSAVIDSLSNMWSKQLIQHLFTSKQEVAQEQVKQAALTSVQTAGQTARAAGAQAANAAQQATGAAAATAIVGQTAAAFTGVLAMISAMAASIAAIPPVGPAMAAAMMAGVGASAAMLAGASAAAAGGIATSMAVPSFDVGSWSVPVDSPAFVHKDELIVPAKGGQADRARAILSGEEPWPAARQGVTVAPKININATALDGRGVGQVLARAGQHTVQGIAKAVRTLGQPRPRAWGRT